VQPAWHFFGRKKAKRKCNKHCTIRLLYTIKGSTALIVIFSLQKTPVAGFIPQENLPDEYD
jgi:hypothetical protein